MTEKKLRIIVFGAHPDDCEFRVGGVALKWAAKGHQVKLVSVTNGDIGHWREKGPALAKRRLAEVNEAAKILGVTTQVLDNHDGEVIPTLDNRRLLVRLIREWKADIVMGHRPYDYHPDHRYCGILMQDAAYMVNVPFFCPETPHLPVSPVFMFLPDPFLKPTPFHADVIVSIDDCLEQKFRAMDAFESQFYEGGVAGSPECIPDDSAAQQQRRRDVRDAHAKHWRELADRFRSKLAEFYGPEAAAKVRHAEAFELCEYGRTPEPGELKQLFPFFP